MRILITGGAGFIGCNMADFFIKKGDDVVVFDNLSRRGSEKNIEWLRHEHRDRFVFANADVRMFDKLKMFLKDVDVVFHTAAQVAVTTAIKKPMHDFEVNTVGTFNVLEAARLSKNNPIIVYCSTNKVYGNNVNGVPLAEKATRYEFSDAKLQNGIPESFPTDADEHTPYGCSKYSGDLYTREYHKIYGMKTVAYRMSCIYGKHQNGNEDQGWVAHFVISALNRKLLTIYGDGKQVRDVLYISDLVDLFNLSIKEIGKLDGEAFNIGGGASNTLSLLELLNLLKKQGLKTKHAFAEWRAADQKVYISDISKIKKTVGWQPKTNVEQGVGKLIEWAKANKITI